MSEEELKKKINKIAVEIEKLEVSANQKEKYIRNRVDEEFGSKISEIESKIQAQQTVFDELSNKIDNLITEKKNMMTSLKNLRKEYNDLKKSREKTLSTKLTAISREKKIKTKQIDRSIKLLEKELKSSTS